MPAELAEQFDELWQSGNGPPDVFAYLDQHDGSDVAQILGILLTDQQHRWKTDAPLKVEDYLDRLPNLASDPECKLQLAVGEFQARQNGDTAPSIDEFTSRFSDISDQLRSKLSGLASGTRKPRRNAMARLWPMQRSSSRHPRMMQMVGTLVGKLIFFSVTTSKPLRISTS